MIGLRIALASVALLISAAPSGHAQSYPSRAITLVVPFPAGGGNDALARLVAERMSKTLGQQVVVENRGGAGGTIATRAIAKGAADGYAILLTYTGTLAINPSLYPNAGYDPRKDFAPIGAIGTLVSVLVAHPSLPASNLKEFIAYAKANPGKLNYASPGSGSQNRLEMEVLRKLVGLDMVHVPYKGGAGPAIAGLIGGETHVMFVTAPSAMSGVKAGRLKILGVTSDKRLEQVPTAPTMSEQGYSELKTSSWQGVFVPAGTPREIVERLHAVLHQAMATPEVAARLASGGVEVVTSPSPAAFADYVAAETQRWAKVVKESNATPD